jgi:post-segregation antitoxin (ccd killing protein)
MAKKSSALAELDIAGEGLAQQDGLAERLARQRAIKGLASTTEIPSERNGTAVQDHNAWRRGKSLIQVAVPEDIHVELSILAKRRRINMSRLVKDALNDWLAAHGQALRIPD